MRFRQLATHVLSLGLLLGTGTAGAQSMLEYAEFWMEPNEFVLSSNASNETVTFNERRPVRVCLGEVDEAQMPTMAEIGPPNDTPLRVERAIGSTIILEAGTCVDFAAQSIELSPVGSVADNWSLHGTVHSRPPKTS
jgi:hypothetical protein